MSGGETQTRMLERRVSNNRADLNSDQQLNYFLAWFQSWSDLQKKDFLPILASKLTHSQQHIISEMNGLSVNDEKKRPLSLFQCQLKLFKEWTPSWSQDKQDYLLLRLKDLDSNFIAKYEEYLECGEEHATPKDYFDPGVPPELVRASRKSSSTSSSPNVSLNGSSDHDDSNNEAEPEVRETLSTIQEDE